MDPNYYAQSQQQYGYASADVNPYYQPYAGPSYPIPGTSSAHSAPVPANAYEYDVGILAQQSVYVPGAMIDKRGGAGGKVAKGGKRTTVLRKGGGKRGSGSSSAISATMFRMMSLPTLLTSTLPSPRLGSSATDSAKRYYHLCFVVSLNSSLGKVWVCRILDPEDFLKAWKEMDGKYVGNRPVKLKKADDNAIRPVEIGHRKAKQLEQALKKNRHKPY
ncbi:RNA-binding domain-containing protein [Salix suchowensis]|nr:RNA-binding domain-containing protein [Salix suchowensis]